MGVSGCWPGRLGAVGLVGWLRKLFVNDLCANAAYRRDRNALPGPARQRLLLMIPVFAPVCRKRPT